MKSKRLLLKNAFRSSWKVKSQLFGISLLVMLMTIILSLVSSSNEQISHKNDYLNKTSNLRDGIFDIQNSKAAKTPTDKVEDSIPKDQTYLYQYYFNEVAKDYDLSWSRTEARSFSQLVEGGNKISMKIVTKTTPQIGNNNSVDSLVVTKGNNFSSINELFYNRAMIINENFAKLNDIKIGDIVRVEKDKYGDSLLVKNSDKLDSSLKEQIANLSTKEFIEINEPMAWFHIIGFGTSADFATPITDITTSFPDAKTSFIGYVKPVNFGLTAPDDFLIFDQTQSLLYGTEFGKESYFSFKFNSKRPSTTELSKRFDETVLDKGVVNEKILYLNGDLSYEFSNRLTLFNTVISAYNTIALFLFVVTILISLFALSIVLKKRVEAVKSQMGCLKALGYWKKEILLNFLAIPSITAAIGVTTGYLISLGLSAVVIQTFSTFFTISFGTYTFSVLGYFTSFIVGFLLLTFFASILILIELKQPALILLKGRNTSKYSLMGTMIKSIFKKASFDTRLRMSIFAGSWLKFVGTFVTILASTVLITFTSITPSVVAKNETASFEGMNYKFVTEYQQPIAENPLTFYKTFNPNHSGKDYGYDIDKFVEYDYVSPSKKAGTYSPLPTKESIGQEGASSLSIDYDVLFTDLINNNISRYNYSPNIVKEDTGTSPGASRMAYLNYQVLTESFLNSLDKFQPNVEPMSVKPLKDQWTDLVNLELDINSAAKEDLNGYIKFMHSFYKKYINGLPITFNNKFLKDNSFDFVKLRESMKNSEIFKNIYSDNLIIDESIIVKNLNTDKKESQDILFGDINNPINIYEYSSEKLLEYKGVDKIVLATQLGAWFNLFFDNRISMYLSQTAYSRAPYFVQESLKNAVLDANDPENNDKSEFSVSFNVVPFDNEKEIRGTMLKASLDNKNSNISIYGIDNYNDLTNFIELEDSKGNDLRDKLFNPSLKDNSIIINESFAKSRDLKVGDSIDLDVIKNSLLDKDGKSASTSIKQTVKPKGYSEGYISESSRSYQSTNGKTFADAPVFGINPVKVGGFDSGAKGALLSTSQTNVNKAMASGDLLNTNEKINKKFVVTGIQKSFGQPQAWTTNEIANNILGYNSSRDDIFENWFKNFDLSSEELKKFIFKSETNDTKANEVIDHIGHGNYNHLKFLANDDSEDAKYYDMYLKVFENTYPIFNYKYSKDEVINDIEKSMSTTTSNGDFSAVGLNGSYKYEVPEGCDQEGSNKPGNQCSPIINTDELISGYAVGSTAMAVPMDQARLVLSQLTQLVQMITIMFIVFAMVISSIIILLVTSIVIHENSQFIATMKLLGYRKRYIVWQIISVYLIAIIVAYVIGFAIGWFSFMGVTNYLAYQGSWILPVQFAMWMPLEVLGLLGLVFLITFYAAYEKIKKLTPVQALNA